MEAPVTVAVVRAMNRRDAVAQALALVADDVARCVAPSVVVKPNLVSHRSQTPSTHADTLSATLDALFAAGAQNATVAEGASDASAGFERFGYTKECRGRAVTFFDLNRQETSWDSIELLGTDGQLRPVRVSRTIVESPCRVSLALAKTHVTSVLTLSLKNMLSSIHPEDRIFMHGATAKGNGYTGWKRVVVEFLKGDGALIRELTRGMGRMRGLKFQLQGKNHPHGFERLNLRERSYLNTVAVMNHNLIALAGKTKPHISVVDGFVAMHREGPRHGTPFPLRTVVAGTDAVAVDAVAATIMGFDPADVGYLVHAQAAALGVANLERIRVVGDTIADVRRRCVPHSNYAIQRHWRNATLGRAHQPHFGRPTRQGVVSR
jgi:uncharacterized protein (DUF362 family)